MPRNGDALRWCLATVTALSGEEGLTGALVTLADVTDSAILREQLRRQATRDALTGCLNRSSAFAALQEHLDRATATRRRHVHRPGPLQDGQRHVRARGR